MKKITNIIALCSLLFAIISCQEKENSPLNNSKEKPQTVKDIQVVNLPGGAELTYTIPSFEEILMVKAIYTISSGQKIEKTASLYENKILIDGFNDTKPHEIELVAISRSLIASDPVKVTIVPLESALKKISASMTIVPDFGGARFTWINTDRAPVSVDFYVNDKNGKMVSVKTIYSSSSNTYFSLRGYAPVLTKFAAIVKDRWDNVSDTIWSTIGKELMPIFEEKVDKSKMSVYKINGDADWNGYGYRDYYFFDDIITPDNFMHSTGSVSWPHSITIDLGKMVKLSRLKIWQRDDKTGASIPDYLYKRGNPEEFVVYGVASIPAIAPDNYANWTLLKNCKIEKPSGTGSNIRTNEDIDIARQGHEFEMPLDSQPVRYIRILFTKTWENQIYCHPSEITFWGQIQQN